MDGFQRNSLEINVKCLHAFFCGEGSNSYILEGQSILDYNLFEGRSWILPITISTEPNTLLNEHLGQRANQGRMLHQPSKKVYSRDINELKKL